MGERLPVMVELGPKRKKVAVWARDWPGLERGGKTEEEALVRLGDYVTRYAPIAEAAGLSSSYPKDGVLEIDTQYEGPGSTDFWGISFGSSPFDHEPMTEDALERDLALMQAGWAQFDAVRGRVSAELRKGPRGGGRDRDSIVMHVLLNEADWASGLDVRVPREQLEDADGLAAYREAYLAAIRLAHQEGRKAKKWPLRYLIRHTAYHTLDHTWEMEDKDLTPKDA